MRKSTMKTDKEKKVAAALLEIAQTAPPAEWPDLADTCFCVDLKSFSRPIANELRRYLVRVRGNGKNVFIRRAKRHMRAAWQFTAEARDILGLPPPKRIYAGLDTSGPGAGRFVPPPYDSEE